MGQEGGEKESERGGGEESERGSGEESGKKYETGGRRGTRLSPLTSVAHPKSRRTLLERERGEESEKESVKQGARRGTRS